MALIVEGDMPSCCAVCCDCNSADDGNFCNRTGNRLGNDWQLYRPLNCPILGEIPDDHGRIVDVNEFFKTYPDLTLKKELTGQRGTLEIDLLPVFKQFLSEAPALMEANK